MKNYMKLPLLLFTVFFILVACKKNKQPVADGPFVVRLNNCNGDKSSTTPYICFDSMLSESRCPANAICITAGYVLIKVSFHENGNTHSFKMVMPNHNFPGATNDTTINGYKLVFSALSPYPGTGSTETPAATIAITQ